MMLHGPFYENVQVMFDQHFESLSSSSRLVDELSNFSFSTLPRPFEELNLSSLDASLERINKFFGDIFSKYKITTLDPEISFNQQGFNYCYSDINSEDEENLCKCLEFLFNLGIRGQIPTKLHKILYPCVAIFQFTSSKLRTSAIKLFCCCYSQCWYDVQPPFNFTEELLSSVLRLSDICNKQLFGDTKAASVLDIQEFSENRELYTYTVFSMLIILGDRGFDDYISIRAPFLLQNISNAVKNDSNLLPALYFFFAAFSKSDNLRDPDEIAYEKGKFINKYNLNSVFLPLEKDDKISENDLFLLSSILRHYDVYYFTLPLLNHSKYLISSSETISIKSSILSTISTSNELNQDIFPPLVENFLADFPKFVAANDPTSQLAYSVLFEEYLNLFFNLLNSDTGSSHLFLNSDLLGCFFSVISTEKLFSRLSSRSLRVVTDVFHLLFRDAEAQTFVLNEEGYHRHIYDAAMALVKSDFCIELVKCLKSLMSLLDDNENSNLCTIFLDQVINLLDIKILNRYIKNSLYMDIAGIINMDQTCDISKFMDKLIMKVQEVSVSATYTEKDLEHCVPLQLLKFMKLLFEQNLDIRIQNKSAIYACLDMQFYASEDDLVVTKESNPDILNSYETPNNATREQACRLQISLASLDEKYCKHLSKVCFEIAVEKFKEQCSNNDIYEPWICKLFRAHDVPERFSTFFVNEVFEFLKTATVNELDTAVKIAKYYTFSNPTNFCLNPKTLVNKISGKLVEVSEQTRLGLFTMCFPEKFDLDDEYENASEIIQLYESRFGTKIYVYLYGLFEHYPKFTHNFLAKIRGNLEDYNIDDGALSEMADSLDWMMLHGMTDFLTYRQACSALQNCAAIVKISLEAKRTLPIGAIKLADCIMSRLYPLPYPFMEEKFVLQGFLIVRNVISSPELTADHIVHLRLLWSHCLERLYNVNSIDPVKLEGFRFPYYDVNSEQLVLFNDLIVTGADISNFIDTSVMVQPYNEDSISSLSFIFTLLSRTSVILLEKIANSQYLEILLKTSSSAYGEAIRVHLFLLFTSGVKRLNLLERPFNTQYNIMFPIDANKDQIFDVRDWNPFFSRYSRLNHENISPEYVLKDEWLVAFCNDRGLNPPENLNTNCYANSSDVNKQLTERSAFALFECFLASSDGRQIKVCLAALNDLSGLSLFKRSIITAFNSKENPRNYIGECILRYGICKRTMDPRDPINHVKEAENRGFDGYTPDNLIKMLVKLMNTPDDSDLDSDAFNIANDMCQIIYTSVMEAFDQIPNYLKWGKVQDAVSLFHVSCDVVEESLNGSCLNEKDRYYIDSWACKDDLPLTLKWAIELGLFDKLASTMMLFNMDMNIAACSSCLWGLIHKVLLVVGNDTNADPMSDESSDDELDSEEAEYQLGLHANRIGTSRANNMFRNSVLDEYEDDSSSQTDISTDEMEIEIEGNFPDSEISGDSIRLSIESDSDIQIEFSDGSSDMDIEIEDDVDSESFEGVSNSSYSESDEFDDEGSSTSSDLIEQLDMGFANAPLLDLLTWYNEQTDNFLGETDEAQEDYARMVFGSSGFPLPPMTNMVDEINITSPLINPSIALIDSVHIKYLKSAYSLAIEEIKALDLSKELADSIELYFENKRTEIAKGIQLVVPKLDCLPKYFRMIFILLYKPIMQEEDFEHFRLIIPLLLRCDSDSLVVNMFTDIITSVCDGTWDANQFYSTINPGCLTNCSNSYILYNVIAFLSFFKNKSFATTLIDNLGEKLVLMITKNIVAKNNQLLQLTATTVGRLLKYSTDKIKVSKKVLSRLFSVFGTTACSFRVYSCISEILRNHVDITESEITDVLIDDSKKSKASLCTKSDFSKQLSVKMNSNEVKLLRLTTLINDLYPNSALNIYKEIDLLSLWQIVGQQISRPTHFHSSEFVSLIVLLEILSFPSVLVSSKNAEDTSQVTHVLCKTKTKALINQILKIKPKLIFGPLGTLAKKFSILEFENKRTLFDHDISQLTAKMGTLDIHVSRDSLYADTYKLYPIKDLLNIHFNNEEGEDAGGVSREFYDLMSTEFINHKLFRSGTPGSAVYCINESANLKELEFAGWLLASAMVTHKTVGIHFTTSIYKFLLERKVNINDMSVLDEEYTTSLRWILDNDITDVIYESFSIDSKDLIPGGKEVEVTNENKQDYVSKVIEYKLVESVRDQLESLKKGFNRVIPIESYNIYDEKELELILCGLPTIDVTDWHRNTIYEGYTVTSPQIKWFWSTVTSMSTDERAKLLQFCTGTSRVPVTGFASLESTSGFGKFVIKKIGASTSHLPSSHTCMNTLNLPEYETAKKLKVSLLKAILEGSVGFGFV